MAINHILNTKSLKFSVLKFQLVIEDIFEYLTLSAFFRKIECYKQTGNRSKKSKYQETTNGYKRMFFWLIMTMKLTTIPWNNLTIACLRNVFHHVWPTFLCVELIYNIIDTWCIEAIFIWIISSNKSNNIIFYLDGIPQCDNFPVKDISHLLE